MKLHCYLYLITLVLAANALQQLQSALHIEPESFKVPGKNPMTFCADPKDYLLTLHSLDLSPNPPVHGQNVTIRATGKLLELIDIGAKVHLSVKWIIIFLINKEFDLCENVQMIDDECPIQAGDVSITKEVAIPSAVPPGAYTVTVEVFNKDEAGEKKTITCMTGDIGF